VRAAERGFEAFEVNSAAGTRACIRTKSQTYKGRRERRRLLLEAQSITQELSEGEKEIRVSFSGNGMRTKQSRGFDDGGSGKFK